MIIDEDDRVHVLSDAPNTEREAAIRVIRDDDGTALGLIESVPPDA